MNRLLPTTNYSLKTNMLPTTNYQLLTHKGQSLIEVLIALSVLTMGIAAAVVLFLSGQTISLDTSQNASALSYAQEGVEALKIMKTQDWNNLTDGVHGLQGSGVAWSFSGPNDTRDIFTRTITISLLDASTKKAEVVVSWQPNPARPQTISFIQELTNWTAVSSGGLQGDWTNPRIIGSLSLATGVSATDLVVKNSLVYLTGEASSSAKPDFFIINASNPQAPILAGSLNISFGYNALALAGNYAYLAQNTYPNQFRVVDISQPSNPTLVATLNLPGSDEALSIAVGGNYAYVGLDSNGGAEFFVIDISNPLAPVLVGSLEMGADILGITLQGDYAYLATELSAEIQIINIINPLVPAVAGTYAAPGNSEDGKVIQIIPPKLYLGRAKGGDHDDHHELHVISMVNPTLLQNLGSLDTASDVNDLTVVENLEFTATADPNKEFQIFEISNPAAITPYAQLNLPQVASGIAFENNMIYLALRSNDALRIITSQ